MSTGRALPHVLIRHSLFVAGIVAALHGAATRGVPRVVGDTQVFTILADRLLADGLSAILTREVFFSPKWTRLLYVGVVALARAVAPEHWALLLLGLNIICNAVLAALVVKLTIRVTNSTSAGWAALVLFLASFEILDWVRCILSDTPFALAAFVPFYLLVDAMAKPVQKRGLRVTAVAAATAAALFLRPVAVIMVPLVAIGIVWWRSIERGRPALRTAVLLPVTVVVLLASMIFQAIVMQKPDRWPLPILNRQIHVMSARAATGEVVVSRPATFHAPPRSVSDFLLIEADRFLRFFQYVAKGFSGVHNFVNAVYFTTLYLLALVALVARTRTRTDLEERRLHSVVAFTTIWIFGFAYLHALTILDFDWRYRLPVLPPFIFLAAVGVSLLVERATARLHR